MITFNKIVNKLCKMEWKILNLIEIWRIFDPDFWIKNKFKVKSIYKIIYRLKANNIIIPIKNSLYFINNKKTYRDIDIIDKYYWSILKKIIWENAWQDYFIWWNKALELLLKDYSLQNKVIVYTKDVQKNISISENHFVLFKTIKSWWKTQNKNIFSKFLPYTKKINIDGIIFRISQEELSLLDSLIIRNNEEKIDNYLINRFIKKFSKFLSRESLWKLVSLKYITSINRLKLLSKELKENELYNKCLDIVKVEGWNCFINLK